MTDRTYIDYPFTAQGVNFVSRVFNDSPMAQTISRLPNQMFCAMNESAITELIGNVSDLSTAELLTELAKVNEGGTHAFILLGTN